MYMHCLPKFFILCIYFFVFLCMLHTWKMAISLYRLVYASLTVALVLIFKEHLHIQIDPDGLTIKNWIVL